MQYGKLRYLKYFLRPILQTIKWISKFLLHVEAICPHRQQQLLLTIKTPLHPFPASCLLPSWHAVRSDWPQLDEKDPIWGDDWLHSSFIRRSPSSGFPGFSSAVRQLPGDLCTASGIISLSPLSLAIDVTDATLGTSDLQLGTRTGPGGIATLA